MGRIVDPDGCTHCGGPWDAEPAQSVRDGRLHWSDDGACTGCGLHSCAMDEGTGPEWLREHVLRSTGGVLLTADVPRPTRAAVLRILRRTYGRTVAATAALLRDLTGPGLRVTPAEAEYLTALFAAAGVAVVPRRSAQPPPG